MKLIFWAFYEFYLRESMVFKTHVMLLFHVNFFLLGNVFFFVKNPEKRKKMFDIPQFQKNIKIYF